MCFDRVIGVTLNLSRKKRITVCMNSAAMPRLATKSTPAREASFNSLRTFGLHAADPHCGPDEVRMLRNHITFERGNLKHILLLLFLFDAPSAWRLSLAGIPFAAAADYPSRPIRLVALPARRAAPTTYWGAPRRAPRRALGQQSRSSTTARARAARWAARRWSPRRARRLHAAHRGTADPLAVGTERPTRGSATIR